MRDENIKLCWRESTMVAPKIFNRDAGSSQR